MYIGGAGCAGSQPGDAHGGLWLDVTRGLEAECELLAREIAERQARGLPVTLWHVRRMERYQSLMRQVRAQIGRYSPGAIADIAEMQQMMARLGLEHAAALIDMQTTSVAALFDRLPVDAVLNMAGNTAAGTPLASLFTPLPGEGAQAATRALMRGIALGWHPTKTARAMMEGTGLAYERSVLIARTEQMRVYRETTRRQYAASGVVEGYRRVAAKSARTCIACLMADGRFYELDVPFEEHPAGRCVAVPALRRSDGVSWATGETWFRRQDARRSADSGPGRYEAWQSGRFDLGETVTRVRMRRGRAFPTPLPSCWRHRRDGGGEEGDETDAGGLRGERSCCRRGTGRRLSDKQRGRYDGQQMA